MAACPTTGAEPLRLRKNAREVAAAVVELAQRRSLDPDYMSPYIIEAIAAGRQLSWLEKLQGAKMAGGKPDDITCIVGIVIERPAAAADEEGGGAQGGKGAEVPAAASAAAVPAAGPVADVPAPDAGAQPPDASAPTASPPVWV